MRHSRLLISLITCAAIIAPLSAQNPPPAAGAPQQEAGAQPPAGAANRRAPRPYDQVITARAVTERGALVVHKVDDRYFFEVPDAVLGRDWLLVSRLSGVPAGSGGFQSAGSSVSERMVRFERLNNNVQLKSISVDAVADETLPIARSVSQNNFAPILAAFPIAAFGKDNTSYVIDVTDFFSGDTPALSGLSAAQRRTYGDRRFEAARSYLSDIRAFPINVEVRHVQTFDASDPPGDRTGGAVSLEMRQSLVLLPKEPMRPRNFDPRVGYFTVERINSGLDVQKAATETFIARWRLEPKDPAAYARGELVEPVKPIVYYIDPATPTRWKRYVKEGVEQWQAVFEKAGFKNAIIAKEPPTKAQDPDWDPDDARISMVRWAASTVRNAVGPHTSDPRTGEIINSEITWYHNHMRSYRNRLLLETGAANPSARSLEIPEALMGETMRQVITHEIGHALGLQHNMVASSSFPVESLRDPKFASKYGVSATIMDYARQNYIAQPGDDYTDLQELYTEGLGQWGTYMGHVAGLIAGVNVDLKTSDQAGAVFKIVPKAKQKQALAFLNDQVFVTPEWLQPPAIAALIGPSPLPARQSAVLNNLMSNARLGRLAEIEKFDALNAYPLAEYMADVKQYVWNTVQAVTPDANRRSLQRAYVARLGAIVNPPPTPAPAAGAAPAAAPQPPAPFMAPVVLAQSDLPALARAQLRAIQAQARAASVASANPVIKAHWGDIVDRISEILNPSK
jgi:hypothetical protein